MNPPGFDAGAAIPPVKDSCRCGRPNAPPIFVSGFELTGGDLGSAAKRRSGTAFGPLWCASGYGPSEPGVEDLRELSEIESHEMGLGWVWVRLTAESAEGPAKNKAAFK